MYFFLFYNLCYLFIKSRTMNQVTEYYHASLIFKKDDYDLLATKVFSCFSKNM